MLSQERLEKLARNMAEMRVFKAELKRRTMIYDYDAKMSAAAYYNLDPKKVEKMKLKAKHIAACHRDMEKADG